MSTETSYHDDLIPPFTKYQYQESFFGGEPPLGVEVGYAVVLGFGLLFSVVTTSFVYITQYFGPNQGADLIMTSEYFNTAGRMVKTGLTASVIISQWTWAATLLQSSNVAWAYGVSGPFWYASGATIQVLLFGVLAVNLKKVAPSAHTVAEIVNARWGKPAHQTFLFFCFMANIIVTSMLLLGGAATVEALTGLDYRLASFLIPWGVILYTASGGLQATFLASYIHTVVIFAVLICMLFVVYVKVYSSDTIYHFLNQTVSFNQTQCQDIFSNEYGETFFVEGTYACGPVQGNKEGSYLTMLSSKGLMFGIINIVGNFGTVFVDQSYWQSAIAARPYSAAKGYFLGGICWFAIPFSLATSLGLASTALMLPITAEEASSGLVPPAVATELLGTAGSVLILVMLFMAIVSTGSAESIAVSSLIAYDVYWEYINHDATGDDILRISRYVVVAFGLFMGVFSIVLHEIGLNLGWVYLFMGVLIGSAVVPLWNLMTWKDASGTGAVIAAWAGLFLAIISWLAAAKIQSGDITVETLGTNEVMLSGNLVAIGSSGFIHYVYSKYIDPQDYDFDELDRNIHLVEDDQRGLTEDELDPVVIRKAERWIKRRGYMVTFLLVVVWPLLSIPAGVFSKAYFAFWVLVALAWGFGAALIITFLPLQESFDDLSLVAINMLNALLGLVHLPPLSTEVEDAIIEEEERKKKEKKERQEKLKKNDDFDDEDESESESEAHATTHEDATN
ncbi:Urea-proton symporter DUR3 [Seminavis robusta]|uniref:Urea-proton symporter DUR3 n=1 Tax=Seminavis robusta TaxID=568900 RepID=A0A9N8EDH8_9STRA|nr:Urea-proton symporter DUR3 [Seminavis robusta]|eukprot:Sro918_g220000.1 Urea-proton symporter DUR3 (734) ;mRNA; f:9415-11616